MQPLTHRRIIGLVEPFTRRGRHVDLGGSDRPDQYIAHVLPLDAHHALADFFGGFMLPPR